MHSAIPSGRSGAVYWVLLIALAWPTGTWAASREQADALYGLGRNAYDRRDYVKARIVWAQTLAAYERLGLRKEQADMQTCLGLAAHHLRDYDGALARYRFALGTYASLGMEEAEGQVLCNVAITAARLENYDLVVSSLQQALEIFERLGLEEDEGKTFESLGREALAFGDFARAASWNQKALDIYRRLGFEKGQATALSNLGVASSYLGDYERAMSRCAESLATWKRLGSVQSCADCLANQGTNWMEVGDYAKGVSCCKRALQVYRAIGCRDGEADVLNNLAMISEFTGDHGRALAYLKEAESAFRALGMTARARSARLNLADVYMTQGRLDEARRALDTEPPDALRWGRYYLLSGRSETAAEVFVLAAVKARKRGYFQGALASIIGLGVAREALGEYGKAASAYGGAVEMLETVRASTAAEHRDFFFGGVSYGFRLLDAYEGLARMLIRAHKREDAFVQAEHTKGRALIDAMARTPVTRVPGIPRSLRARERCLADRIHAAAIRTVAASNDCGPGSRNLARMMERLRSEQQTLISRLHREYPEYAAMHYPQPLHASELALNRDEVLIEYEVTDSVTLVFVVRGGRVWKALQVKATRKDLNDMITRYRAAFVETGQTGNYESMRKLDVHLGHSLYQLLLKDALAGVKRSEKVLIVPDEMLCLLPFEALVEQVPPGKVEWEDRGHGPYPKGVRYVGDTRVFSYWQSASSMTILRRLHKDVGGSGLLAVADPVFGETDARIKQDGIKIAMRGATDDDLRLRREVADSACRYLGFDRFQRLETTEGFVRRLRSLYGGRLKALTGLDATESKIESEDLEGFGSGIVFATHGIVDERVPYFQQAAIVLSNPELTGELNTKGKSGDTETCDGFLTMSEIMGLKMPTEMAAALACVTGMGSRVGGEGVMNLGRAFQYAGARSALISLWSVEDESTNLLGERLFAGMRNGEAKDTALLAARRMLRAKGYEHPFYWAGFSLIGERDLAPRAASRVVWFVAVLLAVLCVIIALRLRGMGLWKRSVSG